ncbi:MAG: C4-type zinc ribbon domain-containing protein [Bifidobacteriaceae bacterium]|nr:C4-type zinc ribbon domain-containing protein [Bifidobacteriaceae bacterium]
MKAPAADQRQLLVVQAHDTQLHRLAHQRANLPQAARLALVQDEEQVAGEELEMAKAKEDDVRRELTRVEDEIAKVAARHSRDRERLDSGGGMSRELLSLQQELGALERRRDSLEEDALEVMELLDVAQKAVSGLKQTLTQLGERSQELRAELDAGLARIGQEEAEERAAREDAIAGLNDGLVKLYERLRERLGGVGAAPLVRRRCEGCGMDLSASDLSALAAMAEDEVARCEECGRILVRGEDCGL